MPNYRRFRGATLARKFLAAIVALSVGLTATVAIGAFVIFLDRSERQKIADFDLYVRERARTEHGLFDALSAQHEGASESLGFHLAELSDAQVSRQLDRDFPLKRDGSRRSASRLFDGGGDGSSEQIHGLGAFLSHGDRMTLADKRLFLAAAHVVAQSGQASHSRLDNFYFFTPDSRMVVFGPDRLDKLRFYRETAPASLDLSRGEMVQLMKPANNPARLMRCTGLQRPMWSKTAALSIACMTPVYVAGRFVGAWGTTMPIGAYLNRAVRDAPDGATNLILSDSGSVIAYPGFSALGAPTQAGARFARDMHAAELVKRIAAQHRRLGVLKSPDGASLVAYGRMEGPGWWFTISTPLRDIAWQAAQSAAFILLLGLILVTGEAVLLYYIVRGLFVRPLERLARHNATIDAGAGAPACDLAVADLLTRQDEIGALARALTAERARSAELLDSLETRVRERTAELERANEAKGRFLANMSHELRTPLNGVIALADSLGVRQQDVESREMVNLIAASGRLLERVLTDVLDFSKIEAGQLKFEEVEFDLETLVFRIAELHRATAQAKGLAFSWRVAPQAMGRYRGDPVRLTQLISNLLSNAVKFTEAGEVELEVEMLDTGSLRFIVSDTGIGFDAATRERLFKRFEQADTSTTRRFGGTGLGLAICASLVELMGGRVVASSNPGRGSRFEIELRLPRAHAALPAPDARAEIAVAQAAGEDAGLLAGLRVLLAEDHPTNQRIVELVLAQTGVSLTIAEDGVQALEALALRSYDVVLMDMQMPVMDGLTAVRELRRREVAQGLARTPVIMLTANAMPEHIEAGRLAGADRHMAKPLRPDALIMALAECAAGPAGEASVAAA